MRSIQCGNRQAGRFLSGQCLSRLAPVGEAVTKRLSPDEHKRRGTYRPYRHGDRQPQDGAREADTVDVTPSGRRRVLVGLPEIARVAANTVLDGHIGDLYRPFPSAQLPLLRRYALAVEKLQR